MAAISSTENMAGTPESVGGLAEAFRPPSHHLQHHTPHHPSQGSGDLLLGEDEGGGGDGPLTPEMDGLQVSENEYCKKSVWCGSMKFRCGSGSGSAVHMYL